MSRSAGFSTLRLATFLCLAVLMPLSVPSVGMADVYIEETVEPRGLFPGLTDPESHAVHSLAWYMAARPDTMQGKPDRAAEMLALAEYMADRLEHLSPPPFSPLNSIEMQQARQVMRTQVGIPPDAPAQRVIPMLWELSQALAAGNRPRAEEILRTDVFTLQPETTLARLDSLDVPPKQRAAFARLQDRLEREQQDDDCRRPFCR